MGLFSWKTQDTDRSICCEGSGHDTFHVIMTDNNGNQWHESNYQGYGEFGGKDFYELLAEMNGQAGRDNGIAIAFGRKPFISPNLSERADWKWINRSPEECEYQGYFYNYKEDDEVFFGTIEEFGKWKDDEE